MIRQISAAVIAVFAMCGMGPLSAMAQSGEGVPVADTAIKDGVTKTLAGLQAAIKSQDIDGILAAYSDEYSDGQGNGKAGRADYYSGLFAAGILDGVEFDMSELALTGEGDILSAAPVTYKMSAGQINYEYRLKQSDSGWLIVGGAQIQMAATAPAKVLPPSNNVQTNADRDLLGDAGVLADRHAMLWIRRLNAPIEEVWQTVSTKTGLAKWWVAPPKTFELKKGGTFDHHWVNTVVDYKENQFIDFSENTGAYSATGGMRFELTKIDDNTTMFMFLDTWGPEMTPPNGAGGEQPGGPGTPWSGVAAGWHHMVDKLENVINGREMPHTMDELTEFYIGHLTDLYRWKDMVQRN